MAPASPPSGKTIRGPSLSVSKAEFGGAVLFGAAFIIVLIVAIGTWSHFAIKKQADSFTAALATLADNKTLEPLAQNQAVLLKKDGFYHWRAIVWSRTSAGMVPLIWTAKVKDGKPFEVAETSLVTYDKDLARSLELHEDVQPSHSPAEPPVSATSSSHLLKATSPLAPG